MEFTDVCHKLVHMVHISVISLVQMSIVCTTKLEVLQAAMNGVYSQSLNKTFNVT